MTNRLKEIFSVVSKCETFADVGCDHGYVAEAMLKSDKCKKAIISDVSEKCLEKARELLSDYIKIGRVESVVSDGFDKVKGADLALIAGMGGEEITLILQKATELPERLVLQPMKNADKARLCAVKRGYRILKDYTFFAGGKYYDLIVLEKGADSLTNEEVEFGRTNIVQPSEAFKNSIKGRITKLKEYLSNVNLSLESANKMIEEIKKLEQYV